MNITGQDTQALVASIWGKILDTVEVDLECNFFDAGGTSLQITQLAAELEGTLGCRLPVVQLFQYTTVASLAGFIDAKIGQ